MKNIRCVIFSVLALLTTASLSAGTEPVKSTGAATVTLSGTIIDKVTLETLPGVTIRLGDSPAGIYSDPDGNFSLSGILPGEYKVKVSCISYKEKVVSVKIDPSGKNTLSVQLEPVEP